MNRVSAGLVVLVCIPAMSACFQALDSSISEGPPATASHEGGGSGSQAASPLGGGSGSQAASSVDGGTSGSPSSGMGTDSGQCQNGFTIDPSTGPIFCTDNTNGGNQPIVTQTPGIELPDGSTTFNPCDLVQAQSVDIRAKYCGSCHGHPGLSNAPFHTILDDHPPLDGGLNLMTQTSSKVTDDAGNPAMLIAPGDPDNSILYTKMTTQAMPPPPSAFGQPALPTPNVSELSVIRSWIQGCLGGGAPSAPSDAGGDDGGGTIVDDGGGAIDATVPVDAGRRGTDAGRIRDAGGRG